MKTVVLWGVGNHGGGPSRKDLRDIAALEVPGYKIFHSTPGEVLSVVYKDGKTEAGQYAGISLRF